MAALLSRIYVEAGVDGDLVAQVLRDQDGAPRRLHDWQLRLEALMLERRAAPFAWGSQDCALFVADAVLAQTGHDPAADWRGAYTDARGAFALAKPLGGLRGLATAALGEPVQALLARVGDVGLVEQDDRELLAVCGGPNWHAPGAAGLVALPLHAGLAAWRVG